MEKAYPRVRVEEAARMLMLGSAAELRDFGAARDSWSFGPDGFLYFVRDSERQAAVPAHTVIDQVLAYATEMERIV